MTRNKRFLSILRTVSPSDRKGIGSDLSQLFMLTGIPAGVLVVLWTVLGLGLVVWLIFWASDMDASGVVKRSIMRWRSLRQDPEFKRYDPNDPFSVNEYTIR